MTVCPDECPSTMGGSCACEWAEALEWAPEFEPGVFDCPECGWVTKCYPNCPIKEKD